MFLQLADHEKAILDIKECLSSDFPGISSASSNEVSDQVKSLQEEISKLKQNPMKQSSISSEITPFHRKRCIVGGLQAFPDKFAAEDYVRENFSNLSICSSFNIESREDVVGLLFCIFSNESDRDDAVMKMNNADLNFGGQKIWCAPGLPASIRIPKTFLFGLKRILSTWDFDKRSVYVDKDASKIYVAGNEVCSCVVKNAIMEITWTGKWKEWRDLHADADIRKLIQDCRTKLSTSKGGGKGKSKAI